MRKLLIAILALSCLIGCGQRKNESAADNSSPPSVTSTPAVTLVRPSESESVPMQQLTWVAPASMDTLLIMNGQRYALRVQKAMDSTQRLVATDESTGGEAQQMHGYEGFFTFTLLDSANKQVFSRKLRKNDFYKQAGKVVVVPSAISLPRLLGYSEPMGAMVFLTGFAVPETDWGSEVVIVLDSTGKVQSMSDGRNYGGGACIDPVLSGDGRVLLTTSEVVRLHHSPLQLERPNADLAGACLLSDTTMLVVYAESKSHPIHWPDGTSGYGRTPSPQQQKAPNAFVLQTYTGKKLQQFRYKGFYEELGFSVPWHFLPATASTYLLDDKRGLYLLSRANPTLVTETKFSEMSKFAIPQNAVEVRFELSGERQRYAFYVDTLHSSRIRYQPIQD